MVSGRSGRHRHEAVTAAAREEAMHPLIIQAIASDQVRAIHEHTAARQRAAAFRRTSAGWLRWSGRGPGSASRIARRPWRDRAAAVLVALSQTQAERSCPALSRYRSAISVRAPR